MKIRSLAICGFRGFSGEAFFRFNDAKVILLYGPNGHGKTSVFDAIEWVLSGEIHRFNQATDERNRTRFIRNLHTDQSQETYVEIELITQNRKIYKVKRTCTARLQDSTDYGKHRLEILCPEPINGSLKFIDQRAEELLKLLLVKEAWREKVEASRGLHLTHILGQEKLNEFLRGMKDGDRYDSLSLLFGTEHFIKYRDVYNELNKKISERLLQVEGQITEGNRKMKELSESIDELSGKLSDPNQKTLSQTLKEYKDNFEVPENQFELEDWRALVPLIEKERETLKLKRYELENKERRLKDLEEIKVGWLKDKEIVKIEFSRLEKFKNHLNDYNKLKLVSSLISRYDQYVDFINFTKNKNKEIKDYQQEIEAIEASVRVSDNFNKALSESLENIRNNNHDVLKDILLEHDDLELKTKTFQLLKFISVTQISIGNLSSIHASTNTSLKLLEESMLELRGIDQKYKKFLSSLSDYLSVDDEINSCPACGTVGINKTYLHQRIQYQQTQIHEELPSLEMKLREMKEEFEKEKLQLHELNLNIEKSYFEINEILKRAEEAIQNKKDRIVKIEKEIVNLRSQIGLKNKFIQEYNEDLLKIGLNENVENDKGEILKLEQQFEANLIAFTPKERANLPQEIKRAEELVIKSRASVEEFVSKLLLAGAPSQAKQWSNEEVEIYIQEAFKRLQENKEKLVYLELVIIKSMTAIENAKEEMLLKTRQEEMRVHQKHLNSLEQQQNAISKDQGIVKDLINNVKPAVDKLNERMISELFDTIQKIFSRINSHPVYRQIDFSTELRHRSYRLLIYVLTGYHEKNVQANATYIFSSAQINSIALSFFMAMGVHQRWSRLQLMGMDDPIQSMDEINVLSLIDLIRLFMEKYNKQFIISTHDFNFYQMMLRKYRNQEIAVIEYEGYSEKGPLIKQQVNENEELENVLIIPAEEPISLSKLLELNDVSL
ncbi:AAA family ATPase [Paenibacillus sp. CMM36]